QPARADAMRQRFQRLRQLAMRVGALEKRSAVNPTVFDYPFQLGMIELRRRDYRRAFVYLHKALALRPHDPRLPAAMAELSRMTPGTSAGQAARDRIARASIRGRGGTGYADNAAAQPDSRTAPAPGQTETPQRTNAPHGDNPAEQR